MAKRDYYEILGLQKNASADEIKKAFRKLAVQYHPDKAGGNEAKFKEINEAYEVLKDQGKRQRYDQFGHAGMGGSGGGASGGNPFGGFGAQGQRVEFDFGDINLGDLFGNIFGGQQGGSQRQGRGRDAQTELSIGFDEAVFGATKEINLNLNLSCSHCKGSGAETGSSLKTCDTCKGRGQITQVVDSIFGRIQQAAVCPACRGQGRLPEKACGTCHGKGVERRAEKIELKIPAGVDDGTTMRIDGRGEAAQGGRAGDLYVSLRVRPHKKFTREGDLILSAEHVSMVDAALGADIEIDTIDGQLTMKLPAGTQSGADFKLSGHGVPHLRGTSRGAHIVTIQVDTPTKLSAHQKELLEEFRSGQGKRFWKN